jgi:phage terminase large subunit
MSVVRIPYNFEPRPYQLPILEAMDNGFKRAVQVWHRRSGKEKTDLGGIVVKKMVERVGTYFYVFPTFVQGRKVLWDGADKDGMRFVDHFPPALVESKNDTEMKIRLKNGSLLQVIGSDNYNASMGTNPIGIVFSEYSLQDPGCWNYYRPILAENGGWAIFNFTPRGENHSYALWELAKADPKNWFTSLLTADDTKAIPQEVLDQERSEIIRLNGNDAIYQQEYNCSFTVPISGAYYAEQLQQAYKNGRIGTVPHESRLSVDTWWDLGVNDRMSVWFTQSVGQELRVIDFMEGSGFGLPHYIGLLKEKPYVYGKHTAPHDIKVRELTTGKERIETARALGINFEVAPNIPVIDGIDAVRSLFDKCWFDSEKTRQGLNALKSYRKQFDEKRRTYLNTPYHDWSSNAADAFRMLAVALDFKHKSLPASRPDKYERATQRPSQGNAMGLMG